MAGLWPLRVMPSCQPNDISRRLPLQVHSTPRGVHCAPPAREDCRQRSCHQGQHSGGVEEALVEQHPVVRARGSWADGRVSRSTCCGHVGILCDSRQGHGQLRVRSWPRTGPGPEGQGQDQVCVVPGAASGCVQITVLMEGPTAHHMLPAGTGTSTAAGGSRITRTQRQSHPLSSDARC
jgi:hypothetical protein